MAANEIYDILRKRLFVSLPDKAEIGDIAESFGRKLEEAASVANLFIKDGNLATVVGRENKPTKTLTADAAKAIFDGETVVLINLSTAGASEAIAAAFLDRKRERL